MKQSRYTFKGIAVVSLVVLVIVVLQLFLTPNSTIGDIQSSNDTLTVEAKITIDGDTEENGKNPERTLTFRNRELLEQHYVKHGKDMGFASAKDYEAAAAAVVVNAKALHKTEAEDGDDVYYVEETNEFVIVSTDGYIRTYFLPDGGINYFNRQ